MSSEFKRDHIDFEYYLHNDDCICMSPILIVEVLSSTTERVDLGERFTAIPSLLEYDVVSPNVPLVCLFRCRVAWERSERHIRQMILFAQSRLGWMCQC